MNNRQSGILLHPTALYGPYGMGDIGPSAYEFIDSLADMGQTLWQILPIGPTDIHNSPYSSISTFAGNHLLISLDLLVEDGLLDSKYLKNHIIFNDKIIDFEEVISFKIPILRLVCKNFMDNASMAMKQSFDQFCIDNSYWLDEYSKYWALKKENDKASWIHWELLEVKNMEYVNEAKIMQFLFHHQWKRLHDHCKTKGIKIIGDMPIYVGHDSSDVYFNRNLFQLDDDGKMAWQSGAPPCDFQENGQLWGSPLHDWGSHVENDFNWWGKRFKKLFEMVDIIRLDHFIGYSRYYRIPIEEETAINGEWVQAPGNKLFQELIATIPEFNVIAEDLGDVTEDVINLRDKFNFPGMRVLQFEIDKIPFHNEFSNNSIVCTGTHDNDTLKGWFESLPDYGADKLILTKKKLLNFFNCKEESIHWKIIDFAFNTASNMIIIPLQDILGKDSFSRFNEPGTISMKNWSWRMQNEQLTDLMKNQLLQLTKKYVNKSIIES